MAPFPAIPTVPEQGQTTLDFSGSSTVRKRPGKPAKPSQKVPTRVYRQWMTGSQYENQLAGQFEAARAAHYNPNESDPEGLALHRRSYSRELKLSAIEWSLNTYVKGKKDGDPDILITRYAAAQRLGITSTMLKSWVQNRARIANQKRGSRQNRNASKGKEDKMEQTLFKEFTEARKVGKAVGAQWFRRHARAIYR